MIKDTLSNRKWKPEVFESILADSKEMRLLKKLMRCKYAQAEGIDMGETLSEAECKKCEEMLNMLRNINPWDFREIEALGGFSPSV